MSAPTQRPTPETIDTLRQKLRIAERVKQAAIDCTKSWDNILDELVWDRPDIDAHEIPVEHLQTMIARYPHHAEALSAFAKRWNSDKPISDEELADMEIDEESVKRSTASCLLMLKWSMRIREAERQRDEARADRDQFRVLWERDSRSLSDVIGQRNTARTVAEDNRARYVTAEHERDEALEALRELHEATLAPYPTFEQGAEAQNAWSERIDRARDRARAVIGGRK